MGPTQCTMGGCIVGLTSKNIFILGRDLNIYFVDFEQKKSLRNPKFKEGLCVDVIYKRKNEFKVDDILVIIPIEENYGETSELPVLPGEVTESHEKL